VNATFDAPVAPSNLRAASTRASTGAAEQTVGSTGHVQGGTCVVLAEAVLRQDAASR